MRPAMGGNLRSSQALCRMRNNRRVGVDEQFRLLPRGEAPSQWAPTMGQQTNKIIKRRRRADYLKRKNEQAKLSGIVKKPSVKKEDRAKKEPAKKAPAKKVAAKKAPVKEAAATEAPAKEVAATEAPVKKAPAKKAAKKVAKSTEA